MNDGRSDGKDVDKAGQPRASEVTLLLRAWSEGDQEALDKLTPLVYRELHRRAHRQMAQERSGQILQTTAIVNEIYVQLIDLRGVSWREPAPFFSPSSRLIRRGLVDGGRRPGAPEGGGGGPPLVLGGEPLVPRAA